MAHIAQLGIAKFATGVIVATLLSLAPAKAQYSGAPSAQPAASGQQSGSAVLAQSRDMLQRHGSLVQHPRYGEVWTPSSGVVPAGWSPYPACHWAFDKQQNAWTYQDPTEWGAIVHHYGRWAFDRQAGWMWIADDNYGPGHVYWKNEGGSVSWAALTPDGDGVVPTEGWQTQDQQAFNAGCRASSPPPPSAGYAPAPLAPAYAGPPAGYGPRPAYYPAPRPVGVYVPPPIRVVVVRPPNRCELFPHSHGCIPDATVNICKRRPDLPFCQTKPKEISTFCKNNPMVPMCKPGGGNGGIAAGLCATNPDLPNCKKPLVQNQKFAGSQRPEFQKHMHRPHDALPKGARPATQMQRPHVFRPTFQQRPHMTPPTFQSRGGFAGSRGGFRFAGGRH